MLGFKLRPSCWYIKHFLAEPSLWLLQWNFKLWVSGVPGREVVEVSQYECVCLALVRLYEEALEEAEIQRN